MIINNPKFSDLEVGDMLTAHNDVGIARCLISTVVGHLICFYPAVVSPAGRISAIINNFSWLYDDELVELCANDNMTVKLLKQGTFNAKGERIDGSQNRQIS